MTTVLKAREPVKRSDTERDNGSKHDSGWSKILEKHSNLREAQDAIMREATRSEFSGFRGKRVYDFIEPVLDCVDRVRFGEQVFNVGDGPKWVCGPETLQLTADCLIYSIGSNYKFQFETAVTSVAPDCEIHVFDGTMNLTKRALPSLTPNIKFNNFNVVSDCNKENEMGFPSLCIQNILRSLGHERRHITWFKIDCEGCEYTVMPRVLEHVMSIDEVFIEVHGLEPVKVNALFKSFDDAGLFVFHKERNHWGCGGYTCVEFSLTTLHHSRKVFDALYHTSTLSLQNEISLRPPS